MIVNGDSFLGQKLPQRLTRVSSNLPHLQHDYLFVVVFQRAVHCFVLVLNWIPIGPLLFKKHFWDSLAILISEVVLYSLLPALLQNTSS